MFIAKSNRKKTTPAGSNTYKIMKEHPNKNKMR